MARCRRMSLRQPHMQRHKTCLQRKAGKGANKYCVLPNAGQRVLRHIRKAEACRSNAGHQKGNHNRRCAHTRHNQILIRRRPGRTLFRLMVDKHKAGYSHNLPKQQEAERISCQQYQHHGHQKQAPHAAQHTQTAALIRTRIAERIKAGNNACNTGQQQKDSAPAITGQRIRSPGKRRGVYTAKKQ